MSAFVVGSFHINCMVSWASIRNGVSRASYFWQGQRYYFNCNEERIAKVLSAENVRSVNFRYDSNETADAFKFQCETFGMHMPPIQLIRAAPCLEYQSCERDDWEDTEACAVIRSLIDTAVRDLPGYDQAAWELTEREEA